MSRIWIVTLSASLVFLSILPEPALADKLSTPSTAKTAGKQTQGDFRFSLGAGAMYKPDYEGSNDYEIQPVPVVEIAWRDRVFIGTREGPGIRVKALEIAPAGSDNKLDLEVSLTYDSGRDAKDNKALEGLGDLEGGAVAGLKLSYWRGPFGVWGAANADLGGDRKGAELSAGLAYETTIGSPKTRLNLELGATYANGNYMANSFGINAKQAANSKLKYKEFKAGAGFKEVETELGLSHSITPNIALIGGVSAAKLMGDASDSPLVKEQGSDTQLGARFGVVYRW